MQQNKLSALMAHRWLPLLIGILGVLLSLVPAFLLGEDGYVGIHDQMDGEVLVYVTHARNFLKDSFPEFMNGMASTSLTPPSYGTVLLYLLLPPFAAFLCNYVFVALVAFVGMYLLLDTLLDQKWLAALVALMFSQLPFYSVYSLSVMGQPLLFYACIRLWNKEKPWVTFVITAVFAAFSSLVLVGFADFLLLIFFSVVLQIRRHPGARYAWIQTAILLVIYLLPNLPLLSQILAPSDVLSHKSGWIATSKDVISSFKTIFLGGAQHAISCHRDMIVWILLIAVAGLLFYKTWTKEEKYRLWGLYGLLTVAVAIAGFYALWHSDPIVALRNQLGGVFVSFQVDRVYWLYPAIWFILFGLMLWLYLQLAKRSAVQKVIAWLCILLSVGTTGIALFKASTFNLNLQKLTGTSAMISWDDFYSPELFQEIEDYIGLPQEDYRVGSVAMYPSVPLYNGFYCIDGYSNNYDLEYMRQFRNIISKELDKSPELRSYYDGWGNRCYIFCAQLGRQYYFTRDSGVVLENLELSKEGLQEIGCDYIFSAVEIANPAVSGLEFLEVFEHEESPYRIYLYKVS